LSDEITQHGGVFVEQMNASFEDSILFLGRILGARRSATTATLTAVQPDGITLAVDGEPVTIPFARSVDTISDVTDQCIALVQRARVESGEAGETSVEKLFAERQSLRTFLTEVVAVEPVHEHLVRITFGGGQLDQFWLPGADTFLYVMVPTEGRDELVLDEAFTFEQWMAAPEEHRPFGAYYTVRHWHADRHEVEALFVLHGDEGALGSWARRARVGDKAALWGPRVAFEPPAGTDSYLLVADETGLPGVAAIIDSLPGDVPVTVVAEVADERSRQELPARPSVSVTWVHRDGAEAGTTTDLLVDAVRALPAPSPATYAWGGGESRSMTAVRKHLRREVGLEREQCCLVAYWRHAAHAADPIESED
jgi:NADPH-dependent ferric siderophore reductase